MMTPTYDWYICYVMASKSHFIYPNYANIDKSFTEGCCILYVVICQKSALIPEKKLAFSWINDDFLVVGITIITFI